MPTGKCSSHPSPKKLLFAEEEIITIKLLLVKTLRTTACGVNHKLYRCNVASIPEVQRISKKVDRKIVKWTRTSGCESDI